MDQYVLILSLGPVQGFIAAARRSRDLWSGSWLLSEISKAAAASLREAGASLVFPAPQSERDLKPDSDLSVGNKIQAVADADDVAGIRRLCDAAKRAAQHRFAAIALRARKELGGDTDLRAEIWDAQVGDYVECHAAWARIGENGYAAAVGAAGRALAARKATRDFKPSALAPDDAGLMLPKSSLDGARETVLPETGGRTARTLRRKLRLADSEQLDCAGVVKRLGFKADQFTPLSRIAAHAWLESLDAGTRAGIAAAYEPLAGLDLATRVSGNDAHYANFPYDAQLCYRFRLDAALRDARGDADETDALSALKACLLPIWKKFGEPCPYGVILLADGDQMGALLSEAGDAAAHVEITRALSGFASGVAAQVRAFSGHAIYAGGDDVLAFVPLDRAVACADALRAEFAAVLQPLARKLGTASLPTLSVGLAIGHMLEPLGKLRELAGSAEKLAKGDHCGALRRNALGIKLAIRSGATLDLRLRWDDHAGQQAFADWQQAYRDGSIPSRVAYDTRAVHLRTCFALSADPPVPGIPAAEFARMLDRARTTQGSLLGAGIKAALAARAANVRLDRLADELIAARWLAARNQRDLGEKA
ncbi:MAG: type III-B CRISPR-associated protein Cas10/Cmr2 [Rhodocyclaceae bacterium]|nr:type III-B CRISPR-associated protein Cas10/Cmr2 [Rhodocyclaceae bacterium]